MSCVAWLQDLLTYARIQPVMNQIEVHPYMRNNYNIDFCRSKVRVALCTPCSVHLTSSQFHDLKGCQPIMVGAAAAAAVVLSSVPPDLPDTRELCWRALLFQSPCVPCILCTHLPRLSQNPTAGDAQGIKVTAYSPLGSPDSASMMNRKADMPNLLHDSVLEGIAKKHSKPPAQARLAPVATAVVLSVGLQRAACNGVPPG